MRILCQKKKLIKKISENVFSLIKESNVYIDTIDFSEEYLSIYEPIVWKILFIAEIQRFKSTEWSHEEWMRQLYKWPQISVSVKQ